MKYRSAGKSVREKTLFVFMIASLTAPAIGVTVSTTRELIDAVGNSAPGDTIYIEDGDYRLSSSLKPGAGVTIYGAGVDRTIISGAPSFTPATDGLPGSENPEAYLFSFGKNPKKTNVTIRDMTLSGPALHGAIYADDADNMELCNLKIDTFLWSAVRTFRMHDFKVHDNVFINAGGKFKHTGGSLYIDWTNDSEFWNNHIYRDNRATANVYGFKGNGGNYMRIHHNTIEVNFAIEFPHKNNWGNEIDHNYLDGVVSIPKFGGGAIRDTTDTTSFYIHHNWFTRSYSLEWARNCVVIEYNVFDIDVDDYKGNLIGNFGTEPAPGFTHFRNNLIRNPGRGVLWTRGVYNHFYFYNNHVIADQTNMSSGFFGMNGESDFSTIAIRDNIIENTAANPRPLVRNDQSYSASIENNTLENITDTDHYENPNTGAQRGPVEPLSFTVGVGNRYRVEGWDLSKGETARNPALAPRREAKPEANVPQSVALYSLRGEKLPVLSRARLPRTRPGGVCILVDSRSTVLIAEPVSH